MSQAIAVPRDQVVGRVYAIADDRVVLHVPDTDYRLHLATRGRLPARVGQRICGRIVADARRVDVVTYGGRYIEPVYGRPRRIQGRIVGGDVAANRIVVDAAVPITAALMSAQNAADFYLDQLVSFDIESGARFELGEPAASSD